MIGTPMTTADRSFESRRRLYRRSRRVLVGLLVGRLHGRRPALERAARSFLRDRSRSYLARVVADRAFALAAAAVLVASTTARAVPPVNLSDIATGVPASSGGFVINGIDPNDQSGRSVSGAGDVNGDGLADLIVGGLEGGYGGAGPGESYVVFGKADTTPVNLSDVAAGTGGFVINGIDPYDLSGYSVSGAGDVNGDGLADLIVGAQGGDPGGNGQEGESYVVFGKTDTTPVNLSDVAAGTGGFVINGNDPEDFAGRNVSGAGDVNGDGVADLIVGATGGDPGGNGEAGESYVIFGPSCPWDCADGDGQVGIVDFLALFADWDNASACDFDGSGVGITDFLALLANWGPCP